MSFEVAKCRHCEQPIELVGDHWSHFYTNEEGVVMGRLYRCQDKVAYGHNAAHPDVPCVPGGPNPCLCTYGAIR